MRAHQIGSYLQIRPTDDRYAGGNRSEEASKGRSAMTTEHVSTNGPDTPGRYEIRLKGRLDARWATWFDGLSLSHESDGTTVLSGPVTDQAALHGVLGKVRDLGLPLISITQVESDHLDVSTDQPR
jgi:hypothetical protein